MSRNSVLTMLCWAWACGVSLVACAPAGPAPTMVEDTLATVATVETVDPRSREVLLRGPQGNLLSVVVGPEAVNLPQVRPGDRVYVVYRQAVAVRLSPPGAGSPPMVAGGLVAAPPGQRPAGALFDEVRLRVRIDAVDRGSGTVTFTGPNRVPRTVVIHDPAMLDFVRRLRPGDEVDIAYREAVALRVEPAPA